MRKSFRQTMANGSVFSFLEYATLFAAVVLVFSLNYDTTGSGNLITNVAMLAFMSVELVAVIKRGVLRPSRGAVYFIAFVFLCTCSLFWSAAPDRTFNRSTNLMLLCILYFLLTTFFNVSSPESRNSRFRFFVVTLLIASSIAALYVLFGSDWRDGGRVSGLIGDANQASVYFALSVPASLYALLNKIAPKLLCGAHLACISLAIVVSGSRTGLILLVLAFLLYWLIASRKRGIFSLKNILALAAIVVGVYIAIDFIMTNEVLYSIIGRRLQSFIEIISGRQSNTNESSIYERNSLMALAFELWKSSPIFGHGINTFGYYASSSIRDTFCHNNYLELLEGVGLVGCVIYYMQHMHLISGLKKQPDDIVPILLTTIVLMLLAHMFVVFYYQKLEIIYLSFLACLGEFRRRKAVKTGSDLLVGKMPREGAGED